MCVREDRDERGRLLPGHSGNLAGKPVRKPFARLLAAAEACGADVVVLVPHRRAKVAAPADDLPPRAA
jgi:hypothetical protein